MTLTTLGMAREFAADGVACNCLWPRTTIASTAVEFKLGGNAMMNRSRKPEIMADAAYAILTRDSRTFSGQCYIDDDVLAAEEVTDFEFYRVDREAALATDIFIDPEDAGPESSSFDGGKRTELEWISVGP